MMSLLVIKPLSFPDLSANCMPVAKTTLKLFFAGESGPAQEHELRFLKLASCKISERTFTRIAVLPTALATLWPDFSQPISSFWTSASYRPRRARIRAHWR